MSKENIVVIVESWNIWDGITQTILFGPFETQTDAKRKIVEACKIDPQNSISMKVVPFCKVVREVKPSEIEEMKKVLN